MLLSFTVADMKTLPDNPRTNCRNCGALLHGEYCGVCGQREGRRDLHFSEAAGDILLDMVTWDSRFWRTLFPLMFRPGFLTAEFIDGRRARYLPPFRLYIIVSFILFLVVSFLARDMMAEVTNEDGDVSVFISSDDEVDPEGLAEAQRTLDGLGIDVDLQARKEASEDPAQTEYGGAPSASQSAESSAQASAEAAVDGDADSVDDEDHVNINFGFSDEEKPSWLGDLESRMEGNVRRMKEEPSLFLGLFLEYLPQVMFLMLPLFAVLLWICYLLSPFHYLQHLVFGLHYHSFAFLLYLIDTCLASVTSALDGVAFIGLIIYLPLALMRVYGSGTIGAVVKSLFIYFAYGITLIFGFVAIVLLTLAFL